MLPLLLHIINSGIMVNYFMSVAKINWLMFVKYSKDLEFGFSYKGVTTFMKTKDIHKRKDFLDISYG